MPDEGFNLLQGEAVLSVVPMISMKLAIFHSVMPSSLAHLVELVNDILIFDFHQNMLPGGVQMHEALLIASRVRDRPIGLCHSFASWIEERGYPPKPASTSSFPFASSLSPS